MPRPGDNPRSRVVEALTAAAEHFPRLGAVPGLRSPPPGAARLRAPPVPRARSDAPGRRPASAQGSPLGPQRGVISALAPPHQNANTIKETALLRAYADGVRALVAP